MTDQLKPCPFCGGQGKITVEDVEPQGDPWYGSKEERFIKCNECGCALFDQFFHEGFGQCGDEKAIKAWNTRAESTEVERLRAENKRLRALAKFGRRVMQDLLHNEDWNPVDAIGDLEKFGLVNAQGDEAELAQLPEES